MDTSDRADLAYELQNRLSGVIRDPDQKPRARKVSAKEILPFYLAYNSSKWTEITVMVKNLRTEGSALWKDWNRKKRTLDPDELRPYFFRYRTMKIFLESLKKSRTVYDAARVVRMDFPRDRKELESRKDTIGKDFTLSQLMQAVLRLERAGGV